MLVSPLPVLSFPLAWRSRRPLNRKPKKTTGTSQHWITENQDIEVDVVLPLFSYLYFMVTFILCLSRGFLFIIRWIRDPDHVGEINRIIINHGKDRQKTRK